MLPVHDVKNPKYAWILTQDRTFLQAERAAIFRTRLIQPGNYLLLAEITGGDDPVTLRRTFHITVLPRSGEDASEPAPVVIGSGMTLVTFTPRTQPSGKRAVLPHEQRVLKLTPNDLDHKPLSLDLDTTTDTNGDGVPNNDVDNENTFFQTDASPLYLWFASPLTSRKISITTVSETGDAIVQALEVLSYDVAKGQGLTISPATIVVAPQGSNTFEFSVLFDDTVPAATPLLYRWDFGDSTESLVSRPTHTFTNAGTYNVQLTLRNLLTGDEVASYTKQATATQESPVTESGSQVPAATPTENPTRSGWDIHSLLMPIAMVLGVIISAALLGIVG